MVRLSAGRCAAALVCAWAWPLAAAAAPRPQFESRPESPRTDAPVQADSIFGARRPGHVHGDDDRARLPPDRLVAHLALTNDSTVNAQ